MTVRFEIESPSISLTMMSLLFAAALMFKSTVHAFPFDMLPPMKMASSVATEASFQAVKATVESNSTPQFKMLNSSLQWSTQLDPPRQEGAQRQTDSSPFSNSNEVPHFDFTNGYLTPLLLGDFSAAIDRMHVRSAIMLDAFSIGISTLYTLYVYASATASHTLPCVLAWCTSVQMLALMPLFALLIAWPLLRLVLLCAECACAVVYDVALASLGMMIRITTASPASYMHAISLIAIICMHMCMKIASSRVAVSGIMMYIISSLITTTMAAGGEQPATNLNEYHLPAPGLSKWNGVPNR